MPLIISPIDGAPMRQIHRYGIEFDVCPTTGGVWLDKGELEKLIALVKEDSVQEANGDLGRARYRDRDDGHEDTRRDDRPGARRRSRLEDLFDF